MLTSPAHGLRAERTALWTPAVQYQTPDQWVNNAKSRLSEAEHLDVEAQRQTRPHVQENFPLAP
jgi:hypothetical protein